MAVRRGSSLVVGIPPGADGVKCVGKPLNGPLPGHVCYLLGKLSELAGNAVIVGGGP